jgi:hypothetical protein
MIRHIEREPRNFEVDVVTTLLETLLPFDYLHALSMGARIIDRLDAAKRFSDAFEVVHLLLYPTVYDPVRPYLTLDLSQEEDPAAGESEALSGTVSSQNAVPEIVSSEEDDRSFSDDNYDDDEDLESGDSQLDSLDDDYSDENDRFDDSPEEDPMPRSESPPAKKAVTWHEPTPASTAKDASKQPAKESSKDSSKEVPNSFGKPGNGRPQASGPFVLVTAPDARSGLPLKVETAAAGSPTSDTKAASSSSISKIGVSDSFGPDEDGVRPRSITRRMVIRPAGLLEDILKNPILIKPMLKLQVWVHGNEGLALGFSPFMIVTPSNLDRLPFTDNS